MKKYLKNDFDFVKYIDVADETPIWSASFGLKLLDYIDYKTNISALDIGFGTGFPLTEIALRLGDSSVVHGIDPWKDTFERVNKKIDYYGIKNIKIIEGVAESIPLDNKSIDLITSNNGINNVNDIDKVLSECSRIIKSGGQFIQTMNTDLSIIEFYNQLELVLLDFKMDKEIKLMHEHISHKRPSIDGLLSRIQKQGFKIKDMEHDQFNYKFSDGTTMLNHYFIRLAFMDSWIKLLPPNKVEQIFDKIELRLNEQSKTFGGIKLSIPYVLINAIKV
jgi:ubiquinone/menaquinone biosynthesis C-methylase UbiE